MRSKLVLSLFVFTIILKTLTNSGASTSASNTMNKGGDKDGRKDDKKDGGSKDKGVKNRVIDIQDMKGKRTVSSAVLSGPASIGVPAFCFKKVDAGPCAMDIIRVYYDYKTFTCRSFSYSGKSTSKMPINVTMQN